MSVMMLLTITWQNFFQSNLNLYLIYLAGVLPEQIGGLNTLLALSNVAARVGLLPLFTRLLLRIHMRRLCSGWRGVAALASLLFVSVRVVASAACQAVSRSLSGGADESGEVLVA